MPIERIEHHDEHGESYASLHVQSDDLDNVQAQVDKYLPRLGGSDARVEGPRNGWVAVYAELVDRDRKARERLASELSNATAAVVCAISVDDGVVVRYVLYERGSVVDEYQSLPEHFGPLPPGDVVALGANPTVVSRLTGAEPARGAGGRAHGLLAGRAAARGRAPAAARRGAGPRGRRARVGSKRADALHRRPLPLRRPRADRARREGDRLRGGRDRPRRPAGLDLREERDRPRAGLRGGRGAGAAGVRGDHGVPRGALSRSRRCGRPTRPSARSGGSGCSASTTGSATPTTRRGAATRGVRSSTSGSPSSKRALEGQPYLSGREFGLADIGYVPWILRGARALRPRARPGDGGLARALLRAARRRGRASRRLGS